MSTLVNTDQSIATTADEIWLNSHFLHWWLLPSLHAHPSWLPHLLPDSIDPLPTAGSAFHGALHQHWSSQLLTRKTVDTTQLTAITVHPTLALCIAPSALFDSWLQHAGILMASTPLRRCIDRASREHVQQALGDQALVWAIQTAPHLYPGEPNINALEWHGLDLAESMLWLGAQLLWTALEDAPCALRERVLWQLPMHWDAFEKPSTHWPSASEAQAVCLKLINTLDSAWLSSLPKTH